MKVLGALHRQQYNMLQWSGIIPCSWILQSTLVVMGTVSVMDPEPGLQYVRLEESGWTFHKSVKVTTV